MSLSLDDKLLGEKVHNYCSSSEDEDDNDNNEEDSNDEITVRSKQLCEKVNLTKNETIGGIPGYSTNTGPKGVVADWKQFKQLEYDKKSLEDREMINLYKNLALTCKTENELNMIRNEEEEFRDLFETVDGLEEVLAEYREKRLNEMRDAFLNLPTFNNVTELNALTFVSSIDEEHKQIIIIIHLYEPHVAACEAVMGCFHCLQQDYPRVKFCNMRATDANMSVKFVKDAVPALVVYKGGELIGNLIQIDKYLGTDFYKDEMEKFLLEFGFIPDKETDLQCKLSTIRTNYPPANDNDDDDDID